MPARIIQNGGNNNNKNPVKSPRVQIKAPEIKPMNGVKVKDEAKAIISEETTEQNNFSSFERARFYAGHDRLDLQGNSVQRVRELQEENDHLQREICAKENELSEASDPLAILADIEHRKIIIARNTGEILKIYLRNEERIKRIKDLESQNEKIQKELMEMQGQFISAKNLNDKTKFASEFFIMKSQMENNFEEINVLSKK